MGLVEVSITNGGWNGDCELDETVDLVLVEDVPGNPAATLQRMARVIQMIPRLDDTAGNPIAPADDPVNQTIGSGVRALVGEDWSDALGIAITGRIVTGLKLDPYIGRAPQFPDPVSTAWLGTLNDKPTVFTRTTAYNLQGEPATLPDFPLTSFGS